MLVGVRGSWSYPGGASKVLGLTEEVLARFRAHREGPTLVIMILFILNTDHVSADQVWI